MQTKALRIDGALYTRIAAVFITNNDQLRAFKQKSLPQLGGQAQAQQLADEISKTGLEARLTLLTWFWHPSLRDPVLSTVVFPSSANIILVRIY